MADCCPPSTSRKGGRGGCVCDPVMHLAASHGQETDCTQVCTWWRRHRAVLLVTSVAVAGVWRSNRMQCDVVLCSVALVLSRKQPPPPPPERSEVESGRMFTGPMGMFTAVLLVLSYFFPEVFSCCVLHLHPPHLFFSPPIVAHLCVYLAPCVFTGPPG